jgi:ferredoxin--NADP+ reductase
MDMMKERQIAIIGSGPGGFYTAQALLDQTDKAQRADPASPGIRIDVIDSLPTPYGLIRAGVAPDHQSIKQITGRFDETAKDDRVRFIGHLCVGRDISLDQLLALYDAVVLATGAGKDRPLGLPGENLKGVYGSAAIVGWYNAHPDYADLDPVGEGTAMAVIGNGNVAIDIARIFAKTRDELAQSDIALKAERSLAAMPMHDIHILGRRGPAQAKFTIKEVRELGALSHAIPVVDPADLPSLTEEQALPPGQRKVLATLREFSEIAEADALAARAVSSMMRALSDPVFMPRDGPGAALRAPLAATSPTEPRSPLVFLRKQAPGTNRSLPVPIIRRQKAGEPLWMPISRPTGFRW